MNVYVVMAVNRTCEYTGGYPSVQAVGVYNSLEEARKAINNKEQYCLGLIQMIIDEVEFKSNIKDQGNG